MPISIDSLNVESLRVLVSDLKISPAGSDKVSLISSLTEHFNKHGFDPSDITSVSTHKEVNLKTEHTSSSHVQTGHGLSSLNLAPPTQFDAHAENRARRFADWLEEFEGYLAAVGLLGSPRSKSLFLYCVGPNLKRLAELHRYPDLSYNDIINHINSKLTSPGTTSFNRFKLSETKQISGESTFDYVTRLRGLVRYCNLKCLQCQSSYEDSYLFDIILRNSNIPGLRTRVFERGLNTLDELLTTAQNLEVASHQAKEMERNRTHLSSSETLNYVIHKNKYSKFKSQSENNPASKIPSASSSQKPERKCKFCSRWHKLRKEECPAYGKTCTRCSGKNHFAGCCKNNVKFAAGQTSSTDTFLYTLSGKRQARCVLNVCGMNRTFIVDTGASHNCIPKSFVPSTYTLRPAFPVNCFSGVSVNPLGIATLPVLKDGVDHEVDFLVLNKAEPLLSLQSSLKFGLVKLDPSVFTMNSNFTLDDLLLEFKDLFDPTLGLAKNVKAKIQLKPGTLPKFQRHRPVPLALRSKVEESLDSMVARGTLIPVRTSQWASPMVTVAKPDGSVRLCGDYTQTLTKVIDVESYPLPHPEELLATLSGKSVFSKLDLRTCFEQFSLDETSKEILTVNTIKGLMRYDRLPYGISSAPAIVQRAMEEILSGLNVCIYLDDILIATNDLKSHLVKLEQVFTRLHDSGLRLRQDKCFFCKSAVKYLGFIISKDGLTTDPEKIKAIVDVPAPTDVSCLRSFLGLVRFYGKFIPNLSNTAAVLFNLLKKDTHWKWDAAEEQAFVKIKKILTSASTLVHFDPSKPLILSCDASPVGLGAVLSHRFPDNTEKPICYASRTLSATEQKYAQIDKEALSIMYGVKKFEKFLFGRKFILVTDHKPLQAIFSFNKGLPSCTTARLQRYAVRLSVFDFKVEYRPGTSHGNADALSRAPVGQAPMDVDEAQLFSLHCISSLPLDSKALAKETRLDVILSTASAYIQDGWPSHSPSNGDLLPYWKRRHELSIANEIIMWGRRAVIPKILRYTVLQELHETHQGMVKMKALARLHFWWPGLDNDIENMSNHCVSCQLALPSLPARSYQPWPAAKSWERVHIDYGSFKGKDFLVLIDAGSKWIEAEFVKSTTTESTLRLLFSWFSRLGFPVTLHSDGAPQFTSEQFKSKMRSWNITHLISPPYHPQSNGLAERAVRIIKDAFTKYSADVTSLQSILFRYRATPLTHQSTSPAELLLGYRLRTRLTLSSSPDSLSSDVAKSQQPAPTYKCGQNVWVRDFRKNYPKWQAAKVKSILGRSVILVENEGFGALRRHISHTRPKHF